MDNEAHSSDADFTRRVLIVIGLAAVALLAWELRGVLLLLFGAVVVSTIIRSLAEPLSRWSRLPERVAVLGAVLVIFALIAVVGWLLSRQVTAQIAVMQQVMPTALQRVDQWLSGLGLSHPLDTWMAQLHNNGATLVSRFGGWLSAGASALTNALLVIFGGIFLATAPRFYRTGAIKLVPTASRGVVAQALDESDHALRLWLRGQVMAMLIIGTMTGAGLWLLGVPSWLVLGLLAGFFEFIPFAGPILSAVPAILIAFVQSPKLALWTTLMYVFVQHSEAYLIQPLIQQYAVDVPAVVLLFALLAFGVLFGAVGVLFAAPLTVVSYVLIKRLYVREALGTATPIPGEDKA